MRPILVPDLIVVNPSTRNNDANRSGSSFARSRRRPTKFAERLTRLGLGNTRVASRAFSTLPTGTDTRRPISTTTFTDVVYSVVSWRPPYARCIRLSMYVSACINRYRDRLHKSRLNGARGVGRLSATDLDLEIWVTSASRGIRDRVMKIDLI